MNILIVEDSEVVAFEMKHLLISWGYNALMAHDGSQALVVLRDAVEENIEIDGIILDLVMHPMDGGEFLIHKMKDQSIYSIPVIIMTAYHDQANEWRPFVCEIIYKPPIAEVLKNNINKFFKSKECYAHDSNRGETARRP